ncbi:DUF805 domain-containing protein [Neisseriaceae bacterium ESL0693]|nr:DUF805 domain-containing protein [Neisseriaceae bacterium ESL0693]
MATLFKLYIIVSTSFKGFDSIISFLNIFSSRINDHYKIPHHGLNIKNRFLSIETAYCFGMRNISYPAIDGYIDRDDDVFAIDPLLEYSRFSGKAGRKEFWSFFLYTLSVLVILSLLLAVISADFGITIQGQPRLAAILVAIIFSIVLFIPQPAFISRRLHDVNLSGTWVLIYFILCLIPINMPYPACFDHHRQSERHNRDEPVW